MSSCPPVWAWRQHTHHPSESGAKYKFTQWAQSRRAGVILPGRQGGIRPHETFELNLEACLGCCQVETRAGGSQAGRAGCSKQMDHQEKSHVPRHTLIPVHTHTLRCVLLPQGPVRNCLKAALAGVAQWTECQPSDQSIAGSSPSQGTCLGGRSGPRLGSARGNHALMFLSLPSFSLKINKIFKK